MFDLQISDAGGSVNNDSSNDHGNDREIEWMALHAEIKTVWKQRTGLEAREIALLLDAEETLLFRHLGYVSIHAYVEAELGYSHHAATERMRVAHELRDLPALAEEFDAGELPWSSVRELTRVVTPATEAVWLDAVEGKKADEVQRMVRGKSKGDLPTSPVDPAKIRHRIVIDDVSEEAMMVFKQARIAVLEQRARAGARSRRSRAASERRGTVQAEVPDRGHHVPHVQGERDGRRRHRGADHTSAARAGAVRLRAHRRSRER